MKYFRRWALCSLICTERTRMTRYYIESLNYFSILAFGGFHVRDLFESFEYSQMPRGMFCEFSLFLHGLKLFFKFLAFLPLLISRVYFSFHSLLRDDLLFNRSFQVFRECLWMYMKTYFNEIGTLVKDYRHKMMINRKKKRKKRRRLNKSDLDLISFSTLY